MKMKKENSEKNQKYLEFDFMTIIPRRQLTQPQKWRTLCKTKHTDSMLLFSTSPLCLRSSIVAVAIYAVTLAAFIQNKMFSYEHRSQLLSFRASDIARSSEDVITITSTISYSTASPNETRIVQALPETDSYTTLPETSLNTGGIPSMSNESTSLHSAVNVSTGKASAVKVIAPINSSSIPKLPEPSFNTGRIPLMSNESTSLHSAVNVSIGKASPVRVIAPVNSSTIPKLLEPSFNTGKISLMSNESTSLHSAVNVSIGKASPVRVIAPGNSSTIPKLLEPSYNVSGIPAVSNESTLLISTVKLSTGKASPVRVIAPVDSSAIPKLPEPSYNTSGIPAVSNESALLISTVNLSASNAVKSGAISKLPDPSYNTSGIPLVSNESTSLLSAVNLSTAKDAPLKLIAPIKSKTISKAAKVSKATKVAKVSKVAKFSKVSKVAKVAWNPIIRSDVVTPVTFKKWNVSVPCYVPEVNWSSVAVQDSPTSSGILFIKTHKTGSSTGSAINFRISRNLAQRQQKQGRALYVHSGNDKEYDVCQSRYHHVRAAVLIPNRTKSNYDDDDETSTDVVHQPENRRSVLWTIVRDPTARAISGFFHFAVSRHGMIPTDDNFIKYVSPSSGDYYLNYLYTRGSFKRNSDITHQTVINTILNEYDFIGITERMDESAVALKMLLNLKTSDVLYLRAKTQGGYDDGGGSRAGKSCTLITPTFISEGMNEFFQSDKWDNIIKYDQLLYNAANASLDRTIKRLGKIKFEYQLKKFRFAIQRVEHHCRNITVFPCDNDGKFHPPKKTDCLWSDSGCGMNCIDKVSTKLKLW